MTISSEDCGQSKMSATTVSARQPSLENTASVPPGNIFLTVEQSCADVLPIEFSRDLQQKISVARAEFGNLFWHGGKIFF